MRNWSVEEDNSKDIQKSVCQRAPVAQHGYSLFPLKMEPPLLFFKI